MPLLRQTTFLYVEEGRRMTSILRVAVVGIVVLILLALAVPVAAGATVSEVATDPVSTAGHVADQAGWHNDWGDHEHGDHWDDHPHHEGDGNDRPHDPEDTDHGPNEDGDHNETDR